MIESSIESLFEEINNSKEYKEYKEITDILNNNKEVKELIDDIKRLQKESVNLEYKNDEKYKVIDKAIEEKTKELNNNKNYKEYLSKLREFNNTLLASSSLLEEYVNNKITI